ncbi:uncharacterized protein LOC111712969 [Eurytemora carolleeae]|uniref:uncharacterized protein LOC111712969 n=1 Tax=Eurytemora carolleeae TaxID=1294199 RepID=UPI000C777545|nr:uncharacterized protein LOC111712969 [Eurytemora carolleeae]|eukprot:XP_023343503.1 uncharacterized protein LOC111712969 [Eurytemora affinis]
MTVGGLASSTEGFYDLIAGSQPGGTIKAGLEVIGQIFGEDVNKEITKILLNTGGRVISGAVTSVFGGVTLLWDVYQLRGGVKELASGGGEGAAQLRNIADQLEEALTGMQDREENPNHNSSIQDGEENSNSSIQDREENAYSISLNNEDVIVLDRDTILDQVLDRDTDSNQDRALDQDAIKDIVTVLNHNHS